MLLRGHLGPEGREQVGGGEEGAHPIPRQQADGALVALQQPPVHLLYNSHHVTNTRCQAKTIMCLNSTVDPDPNWIRIKELCGSGFGGTPPV